jgi:para-aminobenzoate synthetase/4-amino-4-deoxychorismate lyase
LLQDDGSFLLLDFHLERLADSARYFSFFCDPDEIRSLLHAKAASSSGRHRLRVVLHRDGRVEITAFLLRSDPDEDAQRLAIFSDAQVDPADPHRFHKTTRRRIFDGERDVYVQKGYYEVLFCNTSGQVTEGAISNLFIRKKRGDRRLVTPPVSCGLLAGTFRRMLLEQGRAEEGMVSVQDVWAAAEVYLANSVRGLVRVQVEGSARTRNSTSNDGKEAE